MLGDVGISECLGPVRMRGLVEGRSLGLGCGTRPSAEEFGSFRACTGGRDTPISEP